MGQSLTENNQEHVSRWTARDSDLTVEYSPSLLRDLARHVMAGFEKSPAGGPEVGGVLFGKRTPLGIRILAYRQIRCEHAFGPAFELSKHDEAALAGMLQEPVTGEGDAHLVPVGWYHSEYWELNVSKANAALHHRHFPEPWQIALVLHRGKGKPVRAGFFLREPNGPLRATAPAHEVPVDPNGDVNPEPPRREEAPQ